ncbi:MAG: hypothetical protein AAFX94_26115, partial [Myxococcota bacterium]
MSDVQFTGDSSGGVFSGVLFTSSRVQATRELFATGTVVNSERKLIGPRVAGRTVIGPTISPTGTHVAVQGRLDTSA